MAFESEDTPLSIEAARLNHELRTAPPETILRTALASFPGRVALVSSFGAESAVLLHIAASVDPAIPVLFLDTGHLFGQTLDYRKTLTARLGLTDVRDQRPSFQDIALNDPRANLWQTSTDACCAVRKVQPLDRALSGFDAWITGRKRFQGTSRAQLPIVEESQGRLKFNPLAAWGPEELAAYVQAHDLPPHPLVEFGYPSIGCWPCTKPVESGDDSRSGRWAGSEKTECGIHTPRPADQAKDQLGEEVGAGI